MSDATPGTHTPPESQTPEVKPDKLPGAETKPGWKSTEFWMTVGFHFSAVLLVVLGLFDAPWAISTMGVVQYIYTYTRGRVKLEAAKPPAPVTAPTPPPRVVQNPNN